MFIERATAKDFFSLQRSETSFVSRTIAENIALRWSATIEFIALSINISLLWSENNGSGALGT
jgi:hypothetical protein